MYSQVISRCNTTFGDDVWDMTAGEEAKLAFKHFFPSPHFQVTTEVNTVCLPSPQLLGNVLSWHGLVDQQVLIEIAVDGLLNRYILLSLQNSEVDEESLAKCQRVRVLLLVLKSHVRVTLQN